VVDSRFMILLFQQNKPGSLAGLRSVPVCVVGGSDAHR
jgi:hypothetical protein